jgi:hypothetical protein
VADHPTEQVDRVAQAIWREYPHPLPDKWPPDDPEPFRRMACAALDAATRPTGKWLCRTCQMPCSADSPFCSVVCGSVGERDQP